MCYQSAKKKGSPRHFVLWNIDTQSVTAGDKIFCFIKVRENKLSAPPPKKKKIVSTYSNLGVMLTFGWCWHSLGRRKFSLVKNTFERVQTGTNTSIRLKKYWKYF